MLETATCAACGAVGLVPHLGVAGEIGAGGLIPTRHRFGTALAGIVRCRRCTHRQLEPMPSRSMLAGAYGQAASCAYIEEEAGQRETARRTLERIEHAWAQQPEAEPIKGPAARRRGRPSAEGS